MKTLAEKKQRLAELSAGKTLIKCDWEIAYELVIAGNAANIKSKFYHIFESYSIPFSHSGKVIVNELAALFLDLIKKNSNDFTKDIAEKALEKEFELSEKQMWCLAYQIANNKNVYAKAIVDEWGEAIGNTNTDEDWTEKDVELERICFEIFKEEMENIINQPIDILNRLEENGGQFIPRQTHYDLAVKVLNKADATEEEKTKAKWMCACVVNKSRFMTVDADDVKYLQNAVSR